MRLVIALVLLALAAPLALAQGATVRATTEDGRHILVHPGGTWVIDPDPDGPPWPLHDDLLAHLLGDLEVTTRTEAAAGERTRCVLVEARRP